jgi:hypothetical protein
MDSQIPAILGVLIPIIAIVLGMAVAIVAVTTHHRQRVQRAELHHRERMAAIEKGLELPPEPPDPDYQAEVVKAFSPGRYLLRGLVWLLVGVTLTVALSQTNRGDEHYLFGLIPAGVGLAYLIYYFVEGRRTKPESPAPSGATTP